MQIGRTAQAGLLSFATATSLLQAGDLLRAETAFGDCLAAISQDTSLLGLQGDAAYRLSQVYRLTHRSSEADQLLHIAAVAYAQSGPVFMALRCQIELGWGHLLAGDLVAGRDQLNRASCGLHTHPQPDLGTALTIARAFAQSASGATEQADSELRTLIVEGNLAQGDVADAAWILAQNAERRHDEGTARSWLTLARAAAAEVWWPPQMERIFA